MITSALARKLLQADRGRPEGRHCRARKGITRAVYTAVAAGVTLAGAGLAGAGSPARAASQAIGPPSYSGDWAGYQVGGRWFRFLSTTVTVPALSGTSVSQSVLIGLSHGTGVGQPFAELQVFPEGDGGNVVAHVSPGGYGTLPVSPRPGDQLAISMFYDQHGHDYFTATDITRRVTGTVRLTVGSVVYDHGFVIGPGGWMQWPPQADTRLLNFTGSKVTTYRGDRGTLTGPWTTWPSIATISETAAGTVEASPSALSGGGANFGVWLRAIPVAYTQGVAGYADSGGPFRFITTTLTVPARQDPPVGHEQVRVGLDNPGATNIRAPQAEIDVFPGGGKYSVLIGGWESGGFTISPNVGDQLTVSIYYDQHGHYFFTATDLTQHTTQTVTTTAFFADQPLPLNRAWVLAPLDNDTVVPPPADARLWDFTGTRVTTYRGAQGSILGPWATSQMIDTTDGTAAGPVVMSPSALSNAGQNFTVWLRHR